MVSQDVNETHAKSQSRKKICMETTNIGCFACWKSSTSRMSSADDIVDLRSSFISALEDFRAFTKCSSLKSRNWSYCPIIAVAVFQGSSTSNFLSFSSALVKTIKVTGRTKKKAGNNNKKTKKQKIQIYNSKLSAVRTILHSVWWLSSKCETLSYRSLIWLLYL